MLMAWPFFLVAAIFAALYGWLYNNTGVASPARTWIKAGSVVLLAVAALFGEAPPLLVAGLLACAVGDAFLAQDGKRALIFGMGAFLCGQLIYSVMFVIEGGAVFASVVEGGVQTLLIVAAAVTLYWLRPRLGDMAAPVVVYTTAVTVMALLAVGLPGFPLVALGAVMFLASDGVLSAELFALSPESRQRLWTRPAVWALYWGGQALITAGFVGPIL